MSYSDVSLWLATCGEPLDPRPSLPASTDVDVAIVGAGFTGLWTAYYLKRRDPTLRVAVLETDIAGFGASGRNGGWCSALFPKSETSLARLPGASERTARSLTLQMRATVDDIGAVAAEEEIDCGFVKGGTLVFVRETAQLVRAREDVAAAYARGDTEEDIRLLTSDELREYARPTRTLAATYTPHCARIHPAKLVRGLARAVERRGVPIYEQTPVRSIAERRVQTPNGTVRADVVVRATEGYTSRLSQFRRDIAPVYSLMVATEPLPAEVWDEIGLSGRPTFSDYRHLIIYGQRTVDDRFAFGGRGAPYHFGSAIKPGYDRHEGVFDALRAALGDLFPAVRRTVFTHAWGGPLGVPRDWTASAGFDRTTGLAWAGGYVGDGVSTTNLAGRTLTDLITGTESELTRLPWVNHRSRHWEPEPLRWLETNAGRRAVALADKEEKLTQRPSRIARLMAPLLGGH